MSLYSDQNLPEDVSLEQSLLGFDYCTPVMGTLTSGFGYREHPIEGEERFHYGIDLAANIGTASAALPTAPSQQWGTAVATASISRWRMKEGIPPFMRTAAKLSTPSGDTVEKGETIARGGGERYCHGPASAL